MAPLNALPSLHLQTFFVDEDLKHSLRLDAIITGGHVLRCRAWACSVPAPVAGRW